MRNEFYFQINVSDEQIEYANSLVDYSMRFHKVSNIWDNHPDKKEKTRQYRFTGSLGEVVFADTYNLERPNRSFGAYDGQDLGKDFVMKIGNIEKAYDIKSMQRKTGYFYGNYVLNIPSSQLHKPNSLTNYYFCISFHKNTNSELIASFLGFIDKTEIENGNAGILYKAGTTRVRADRTNFQFNEDTYEIDFKDISTPTITDTIKKIDGFKVLKLK